MKTQNPKKIKPGDRRKCEIFCYGCLRRFGHENNAHKYEKWVDYRDVKLKHSPITGSLVPVTGCERCNSQEARLVKIYGEEKTKGDLLKQIGKTEGELIEAGKKSRKKYEKKFGKKRAHKDFLQPYSDPEGTPNEEFVEEFMDKTEVEDLYSDEKLEEKGMTKLIERKNKKRDTPKIYTGK